MKKDAEKLRGVVEKEEARAYNHPVPGRQRLQPFNMWGLLGLSGEQS